MGEVLNLTSTDSLRSPVERRRRGRVQGETEAWIFSPFLPLDANGPAEDDGWEVRVYDVSRFGVGFASTMELPIGSTHRLRIGRGPMHRARLVRVIVCRQSESGLFNIGGEFLDSGHRPLAKAG